MGTFSGGDSLQLTNSFWVDLIDNRTDQPTYDLFFEIIQCTLAINLDQLAEFFS